MEPTTKPAKNEPNPVRDELAETDWAETETERVTRDLERTTIQDKDNNVPEGNQPDTDTTTDTGEDGTYLTTTLSEPVLFFTSA